MHFLQFVICFDCLHCIFKIGQLFSLDQFSLRVLTCHDCLFCCNIYDALLNYVECQLQTPQHFSVSHCRSISKCILIQSSNICPPLYQLINLIHIPSEQMVSYSYRWMAIFYTWEFSWRLHWVVWIFNDMRGRKHLDSIC